MALMVMTSTKYQDEPHLLPSVVGAATPPVHDFEYQISGRCTSLHPHFQLIAACQKLRNTQYMEACAH